jgi:hypothetical protein
MEPLTSLLPSIHEPGMSQATASDVNGKRNLSATLRTWVKPPSAEITLIHIMADAPLKLAA